MQRLVLGAVPNVFALHQNYPNPFNPSTSIKYILPNDGIVNLAVYDMMGKKIKTLVNGLQTIGYKTIKWDATNEQDHPVSAGLYLYTIHADDFSYTRKMAILK